MLFPINASLWSWRVAIAAAALAMPGLSAPAIAQTISQPVQPTSGPGGSNYPYASVRISQGGSGVNAYYVFEPVSPQPVSAPLVIMLHGYYEFSGYDNLRDFIIHTVRKGNVVVYPRWQTGIFSPCAGSTNLEQCMTSAKNGVKGGIAYLQANSSRVQPQLDKTSYFGFSFGGLITANLANRWSSLGLPQPRLVFLDDPTDGSATENTFDSSMAGIPAATLVQCHIGSQGITSESGKSMASCNKLFPKLGHIPVSNKNLVMLYPDSHGTPATNSKHGVSQPTPTDAYDWYFVWKVFDAMRNCAFSGADCQYAMGDTPEHRSTGVWSDGVPIRTLKIQTAAPALP
jgi:hypothetical protein